MISAKSRDKSDSSSYDRMCVIPSWSVRFDPTPPHADPDVALLLARIDALGWVLDGLPLPPRLRERLNRINVALRAVRGTIGIEGTHLTEAETGEILDSPGPVLGPERAREEQEARNSADVMRFIAASLADDPGQALTEELDPGSPLPVRPVASTTRTIRRAATGTTASRWEPTSPRTPRRCLA